MLLETLDHVAKQKAAGKSVEDIVKTGVQEKYKSWAWQFIGEERWIKILFRSL